MAKSKVDIVIKARDQASKKFGKIGGASKRLAASFKSLAVAGAAFLGARALFRFGKESIELFNRQELAVNQLTAALENLGEATTEDILDMLQFASQVQRMTTIGDEATLEIAALGASMGGLSGKGLKQATIAAIGFSKSLKIDMKAAMTLIAKAAQGNSDSFSRYGIQLDKNMTAQEKFQVVLAKGAEGFKLAEAETETFGGKLDQLSNIWGDLQEKIAGTLLEIPGLIPAIEKVGFAIENLYTGVDIFITSMALAFFELSEDMKHWFGTTMVDDIKTAWTNADIYVTDQAISLWKILNNAFEESEKFLVRQVDKLYGEDPSVEYGSLLRGGAGDAPVYKDFAERVDRPITIIEQGLKDQLAALGQKLLDSEAGGLFGLDGNAGLGKPVPPKQSDIDKLVLPKAIEKAIDKPGDPLVQRGSVEAIESRFLTFSNVKNPVNKSNELLTKILTSLEKQKTTQEKTVRKAQTTSGLNQLMAANFA